MSFGFSPSDIVVAYQLAHKIHHRCFTKAQRAGKLYCVYYINFHALGEMTQPLDLSFPFLLLSFPTSY